MKRAGLARLKDAENTTNSLDGRFDLAYNAALRHCGFRPANRYIVFQVLPHTLGLGPEVWRVLAKCHEIRNRGEYEGDVRLDLLDRTIQLAPERARVELVLDRPTT